MKSRSISCLSCSVHDRLLAPAALACLRRSRTSTRREGEDSENQTHSYDLYFIRGMLWFGKKSAQCLGHRFRLAASIAIP
jgi:hypothetical protein